MNRLTPEQLVLLNQKINPEEKVLLSTTKLNQLKEITDIPYQKDEELFYVYRGTIEKAAKLGNLIVSRKPFYKSNQETAILALLTLLDINGYRMENYFNDIEDLRISLGETDLKNTIKWIKEHSVEDQAYINSRLNG